jgi:hypothetical protein
MAAIPASAQETGLVIDLLPGHPVYHEREQEAGVVMAISITPSPYNAADLMALCEELRVAAGLKHVTSAGLALEVVFVVPYKGMAIEGYYFPTHDELGRGTLVPGNGLAREVIDDILGHVGVPAGVIDETNVEQEISCQINEPAWLVRWEDVRPVDGEPPDTVIEHARRRFMRVYRNVIDYNTAIPLSVLHKG